MKKIRECLVPCLVIIIAFFMKVFIVAAVVNLPATGAMDFKTQGWTNPVNIQTLNTIYSDTAVDASLLYTEFDDSSDLGVITSVVLHIIHHEDIPGDDRIGFNVTNDSGFTWALSNDTWLGTESDVYASRAMNASDTGDSANITGLDLSWTWAEVNNIGALIKAYSVTTREFTMAYVDYAYLEVAYTEYTPTFTPTFTESPVDTATDTPTYTYTPTYTESPVDTATDTPTYTFTESPVDTATDTPTNTYTPTYTESPLDTATDTPTYTSTESPANTATDTPTYTNTPTFTESPIDTATDTPTYTSTESPVSTATDTPTYTYTPTFTESPVDTATDTPTHTFTESPANTATDTPTHTNTPTYTESPVGTATDTPTYTYTPTFTESPVDTVTDTPTYTSTESPVNTSTDTPTRTNTPTITESPANTATDTPTHTNTPTFTESPANTATDTPTHTNTPTFTESPVDTATDTPTYTSTESPANTATDTPTYTYTPTYTESPVDTATLTPTYTLTYTNTASPSSTITQTHTASPDASATITPTFTISPTPYGEGSAVVSPLTVAANTAGNTMTITYTAGPSAWGSGTLRLTIPAGWSAPSRTDSDPGFYKVSVAGGIFIGTAKAGQVITVLTNALTANTGTITIVYGDKSNGGPGATSQAGMANAVFYVETNPNGSTTYPISIQPQVSMTVATATATVTKTGTPTLTATPTATASPTFTITPTAIIGEGTMSILPGTVTIGGTGITLVMDFITGPTAWATPPGSGNLKITVPAGWTAPSRTLSNSGYFSVSLTGGTFVGASALGQDMNVRVSGLLPGQRIRVSYGDKTGGGIGVTAPSAGGTVIFYTESNFNGLTTYRIANQPSVLIATATATPTATITLTPTNTPNDTPVPPSTVNMSQAGNNTSLSWNTSGQTDYYKVYYTSGAAGKLGSFPGTWQVIATVLPTPGVSAYTHVDATGNTYGYYIVTGINMAGESRASSLVSKVILDFRVNAGNSSIYRPSLPYVSKFTNASSIVSDIEGNTYAASKINQMSLWNPYNQASIIYQYNSIVGNWLGVNWAVDAGTASSNALYVGVVSGFQWIVLGKDKVTPLFFNYNTFASGISNSNKRSMPYGSGYAKASDIVVELEGGTGAGTNTKIERLMAWDAASQAFVSFAYNPIVYKWLGIDFSIKPGDSLTIYPSAAFTWTPKLVITPVP